MFGKIKTGTSCFKKTQWYFRKQTVTFSFGFTADYFFFSSVKNHLSLTFFCVSYVHFWVIVLTGCQQVPGGGGRWSSWAWNTLVQNKFNLHG